MKAPRIGYQDGGKTKKPLDYSKSKEVKGKTREQLLSEGYKEIVKDGKKYFYKEGESSTPKREIPPTKTPVKTSTLKKAPFIGKKPTPTPGTKTEPTKDYSQEIVYLTETTKPKDVGVNLDIDVRGEEKRTDYDNYYTISYPDTKGGGGMSDAKVIAFNKNPKFGPVGTPLGDASDLTKHFDVSGSYKPILETGKLQTSPEYTPKGQGSIALMSEDVNKNSLDYMLSNTKNPIETTGNKWQEQTTPGVNAPYIDKSSQGILTGLQDIETLPTTELKKRDITTITSPQFNKGGKVMKAPKGIKIKGYLNGGQVVYDEAGNPIQYDANGNPITSGETLPLTGGTEFKTTGDVANTSAGETTNNKKQLSGQGKTALGKGAGAYGGSYWATKENDPNLQGESARNTAFGAIGQMGAIGGVISGVAAVGDQIGAPIKKKSEETDQYGNLKNQNKAQMNAVGGGLLSPSKALQTRASYKGGFTDLTGKKYAEHLEKLAKEEINEGNLEDAMARREAGETGVASGTVNIPQEEKRSKNIFTNMKNTFGFAHGGKIVGNGTATSDSINAKVEGGSHVVPAENAKLAEVIRKVVLKKAPNMKANLNQSGGTKVKLSDGEHIFSPEETAKLEALGIDLDDLSPNAESDSDELKSGGLSPSKARKILHDGTIRNKKITDKQRKFFGYMSNKNEGGIIGYKDGGAVPEGTKLGQYYYRNGWWDDGKGNKLTKEFGQKYTDAYHKQVDVAPTKTTDELNKLTQKPADKLGKKTPSAPKGIKKVAPTTDPNLTYISPQDLATAELIKAEANKTTPVTSQKTVAPVDPNLTYVSPQDLAGQNTQTDTTGKSWKAWMPQFGSAIEIGASAAQIGLGLSALKKAGVRPTDKIDPTFQANVDRAQAQSNYGFSPEENLLITQQNQNAINAARFAARNYSGGSAGSAFNMERSAINEGWGRGLQAKIANQNLMLDKQQYATNLGLQKAQMSRQLFGDKMQGWQQQQTAGGNLVNVGLGNLIGSQRYAKELEQQKLRNQFYNI